MLDENILWKQKTDEERYKELLKGWTDIQQHFREEILVNSWLVLFGRAEVNGVLELSEFEIGDELKWNCKYIHTAEM